MPKVPKRPVNYRGMEQLSQSCGTCRHYIPEYADQDHDQDDATGCELVAGAIEGDFVCDLFKKVDLDNIESGYDWDKPAQVAPLDMSALPTAWDRAMWRSRMDFKSPNSTKISGLFSGGRPSPPRLTVNSSSTTTATSSNPPSSRKPPTTTFSSS